MGPLLLLDGNSLTYRAFFALPTDMATASGQVTNAVYGFTAMLVNLLAGQNPSGLAVAFDRPEPTFRHEAAPSYKEGRAEAPDLLRQQLGLVRRVVEALNVPVLEVAGFEADDILATLATRGRDARRPVVVVTGDRDCYQLVEDPYVKVLYTRRGVTDHVLYDEAGILERTGVPPSRYADYAALRGDTSDNLPGVPGVGEKTAARLITQWGNLSGVYEHLGELTPRLAESLRANREQAFLNASLIPLVRQVPLEVELDDLSLGGWDREEVRQLFVFLEFRSLWERLNEAVGGTVEEEPSPEGEPVEVILEVPTDPGSAVKALKQLESSEAVAVEPEWSGRPGRSLPLGLSLYALPREPSGSSEGSEESEESEEDAPAAVLWLEEGLLQSPEVAATLADLLRGPRPGVYAHHAKELVRALDAMAVGLEGLVVDTAVAAYLVDPAHDSYEVADLASRRLGWRLEPESERAPSNQLDFEGTGSAGSATEAARRCVAVFHLAPALLADLEARGQAQLYQEVEGPLVSVLARMESAGVRVDSGYLTELVAELAAESIALEESIQVKAGVRFKVNSTPQLREVLYDKLGLRPQRKTKTGYSTDAATLEKLRDDLAEDSERQEQLGVIEDLLRYREVEKLRATFGVGLLAEVGADGRIHASFNQTVARTGRLSSDQPNLHNIPVRSEDGRRFRRAFVPSEGCRFLVADYDQIELRVIAHLSSDPGLVGAFGQGTDIHANTAAAIFGVEASQVTSAMRSKAKMVSYGLAYGMEAYGLARRLGVEISEADAILRSYFEAFPRVRQYMDGAVAQARKLGYTETAFGRRRYIAELASPNPRIRQAGERQAMNAGIQGTAADIFKIALVELDRRLAGRQTRLVLQVHDEVILEVPPEEELEMAGIVSEALEGAAALAVPLTVHLSWGDSWAEAKS